MFIPAEGGSPPAALDRPLVVCVDDAALDDGVTDAVLALARAGRVSATSAMVESPHWPRHARTLIECSTIDLGLHLNLTHRFDGRPAPRLSTLLLRAIARRLDPKALRTTIDQQLDAFVRHAGRLPDHVDGHQHVQQLPQVREALFDCIETWWRGAQRPWLRCALAPPGASAKARVIEALGARRFARLAEQARCPTNPNLIGVYGFEADAAGYRARLQRWLADAPDGALLMTHPALRAGAADPIAAARVAEHGVLASDRFAALLHHAGRHLVRGSELYRITQ
ncbi:ChbG/HpnK family deacetylase [Methylibium sp.]|uniref:ChbG/HpnK family deacetylase n=1 Tax=Methylibium sp. TaxID=2067992 RepID=UPI003D12E6E1